MPFLILTLMITLILEFSISFANKLINLSLKKKISHLA